MVDTNRPDPTRVRTSGAQAPGVEPRSAFPRMPARVTVFGGSGFIGRYVVRRLAAQGHVVQVAVRYPNEGLFLKPAGNVGQIVLRRADVAHEGSVAATVAGADWVVNLVGILYQRGKARFGTIHRDGAARIARAAAAAGVGRLVHVSAIGADGASPSAYARSKADGEREVRGAFPAATILRPSLVIGPEDDFFNRFAALARLAPALPLIGGGKTRFQPVYVDDVAAAVVAALTRPDAAGGTFELGGPAIHSFRDLMVYMLACIDRKRLLVPVPFWAAHVLGFFGECLPVPPLTRDQVALLRTDNVVTPGRPGFAALGIEPNAIEGFVPDYLARFRRTGDTSRRLGLVSGRR